MSVILRAAAYAARAHLGQTRKDGTTPYIIHPARVAGRVAIHPIATEEMVAAAFLHDVVEDTKVTHADLAADFVIPIADLVKELTNKYTAPGMSRHDRKKLERVRLGKISLTAKIIKLLDRIDNLKDLAYGDKFGELYASESLQLGQVIGHADSALYEELKEAAQRLQESRA